MKISREGLVPRRREMEKLGSGTRRTEVIHIFFRQIKNIFLKF